MRGRAEKFWSVRRKISSRFTKKPPLFLPEIATLSALKRKSQEILTKPEKTP
jgi:hypothetical protein